MYLFYSSSAANGKSQTVPPIDYMATEPEDTEHHIVTLADPQEEYSMDQVTQESENEAQGAVESFSIYSTQTTSEPEEHNHTLSSQEDVTASTRRDITTPASTDRYLESTEVTWQEVQSVPEIYMDPKNNNVMQEGEPEIKASSIDGVKSSNHRHYQPMPDTNLEPGEPIDFIPPTEAWPKTTEAPSSQPKEINGSKHFQPMPDTNLEDEDEEDNVTSAISMTTEGTTLEYDSSNDTTTYNTSVQSGLSTYLPEGAKVEKNAGNITEAPESEEDQGLLTHTAQSTSVRTSSTKGWLEGSGEDLTLLSTEMSEHLVTPHISETYGASTTETMTESFSLTHLNNISPSK